MKFKKMLKESARLASEEWLNSLPQESDRHIFSERFEWRIRKIPEQHFIPTHPILNQVPKYAASFLLFGLLSSGLLFATNVNARNSIIEWLEENVLHIEYQGNNYFSGLHFEPTWIPEGYHFEEIVEMQFQTFLHYADEQGNTITFSYFKNSANYKFEIDPNAALTRTYIQNNPGYVQTWGNSSDNNANKNNITWFDEKNNIIFIISGPIYETELIRMAQSVAKQNS